MPRPRQTQLLLLIQDMFDHIRFTNLVPSETRFSVLLVMRSTCRRAYRLFSPLVSKMYIYPFIPDIRYLRLKLSVQFNDFDLFQYFMHRYFAYGFIRMWCICHREYYSIISWIIQYRPNCTFELAMRQWFPELLPRLRTIIHNQNDVEREVYRGLSAAQLRHVNYMTEDKSC